MLRSALFAVATAGLMLGQAAPASAHAAAAGVNLAPGLATKGTVIDVRRGGRRFGGGKWRGFRGGGVHRGIRSFRHRGHRGHRRWRRGIYFGAPYVIYRSYGYGNCRWLRRKAIRTGSRYWWGRYYRCRNAYYY